MVGEAEVVERRVERIEEGKVLLHEGERKGHDLEETTFGEEVDTQACDERKENKGILERNLGCINFVLIVLGILCITFMVHHGGAMLGERAAAPTLGIIVCLYSVTTGIAYFARKLTPLKSNTKINAAGYPVPRYVKFKGFLKFSPSIKLRCFTSRHLFCAINFTFGTSTLLAMVTSPPHYKTPS